MLPQPLCPTLRQSTHLPNKIIFQHYAKHDFHPFPIPPFRPLPAMEEDRCLCARPANSPQTAPPALAGAAPTGLGPFTPSLPRQAFQPPPACPAKIRLQRRHARHAMRAASLPDVVSKKDAARQRHTAGPQRARRVVRSVPPAPRPPCRVPKAWPAWHRGRSISRSSA